MNFSPATSTLIVSPSTTSITRASVNLASVGVGATVAAAVGSVGVGLGDGASVELGGTTIAVGLLTSVAVGTTVALTSVGSAPSATAARHHRDAPAPCQPHQQGAQPRGRPPPALTLLALRHAFHSRTLSLQASNLQSTISPFSRVAPIRLSVSIRCPTPNLQSACVPTNSQNRTSPRRHRNSGSCLAYALCPGSAAGASVDWVTSILIATQSLDVIKDCPEYRTQNRCQLSSRPLGR